MPSPFTPKSRVSKRLLGLIETSTNVSLEELPPSDDRRERAFVLRVKAGTGAKGPKKPPTTDEYSKSYLLENAAILLGNGDYLLARNLYSAVLQRDIQDPGALKGLGICLYRLGNKVGARKCFNALWEIHERTDALVWLGLCLSREGDDDGAIRAFRRIPGTDALSAEEHFDYLKELGNCHLRRGDEASARDAYLRAKSVGKRSDQIEVNLGMLELKLGRLDAAEEHFSAALELEPRNSKAISGKGLIALAREDRFTAEKLFHRALDCDGRNQTALLQLVSLSHRGGEYRAVLPRLEEFVRRDASVVEVNYAYATVLFKCSRWAECAEALDRVLRAEPYHPRAQRLRRDLSQNRHPA